MSDDKPHDLFCPWCKVKVQRLWDDIRGRDFGVHCLECQRTLHIRINEPIEPWKDDK
jgi:hypothetical protein